MVSCGFVCSCPEFNRFVCLRCGLVADFLYFFVLTKGLVAELRVETLVAVHLEPISATDRCRVYHNAGWKLLQRVHEALQGPRRHIASRAPLGPAVPISRQLSRAYPSKVANTNRSLFQLESDVCQEILVTCLSNGEISGLNVKKGNLT